MQNSKIEWTHHTYNPWWGCVKVSPGCEHCYAESFSKRTGHNIWGPAKTTTRRTFGDRHWNEPIKWNAQAKATGERQRVFCASMADVFEDHPAVVDERRRLLDLIVNTPWLTWLLLTKRPENVNDMIEQATGFSDSDMWFHAVGDRVWVGTSVEDQQRADERIPHLMQVPAKVRFLSCEPLLGPVDLAHVGTEDWDVLAGWKAKASNERGWANTPLIHWVIVGGESGHSARIMHPDWAKAIRDHCERTETAFHFKQWGEYIARFQLTQTELANLPDTVYANAKPIDGDQVYRVGKHAAGRLLDGREWNEYPATSVKVA